MSNLRRRRNQLSTPPSAMAKMPKTKRLFSARSIPVSSHAAVQKPAPRKKRSPLQAKMLEKLNSGKFRMLNESMYTATGADSKTMMEENPELFEIYHQGYARQVKKWPSNPLDSIIGFLKQQKKGLNIADLGCGEARLGKELMQHKVKSYDLVAANDTVTECDIAHIPLEPRTMQVVVFCLSLMGTNYAEFLKEAHRILSPGGLLLVAEVASRFPNHDASEFIKGVQSLGFRLLKDHPTVKVPLSGVESANSKKGKRRRKKSQDQMPQQSTAPGSAFFVRLAFKSIRLDAADPSESGAKKKLPELLSCQYKKR